LSQNRENAAIFKVSGLDKDAVSKIRSNVGKLDAVQSVQVDVKKGTVKVILKKNKSASVIQLKNAIEQSGYRVQQTLQSPLELGQLEKRMP
jgi:copper chaperone CopZ